MPKEGVVLFGEPERVGLIYSSCFFKKLAREAPAGITIIQTDGTESENDRVMASEDPGTFYHVGHGSPYIFTIEDREKYIDGITGQRIEDFKGRIVHLLSCETAQRLGQTLIDHGAIAYIGYYSPFIYGIVKEDVSSPEPCSAPSNYVDYYNFIDCDVEIERKLLKGATIEEAVNASKSKADKYIERYTYGDWKKRYIAPYVIRFLRYNKNSQRVFGNKNAKLTVLERLEVVGWDPLKWALETVEETRPKIPVRVIEDAVYKMAVVVVDVIPDIKLPVKPPAKPPKLTELTTKLKV